MLGGDRVRRVVETHRDAIAREVLAADVRLERSLAAALCDRRDVDVDGEAIRLEIQRV